MSGVLGQPTLQELMADVWTLRSQARVGSYQHELSSGPWRILAAEEGALRELLDRHSHVEREG